MLGSYAQNPWTQNLLLSCQALERLFQGPISVLKPEEVDALLVKNVPAGLQPLEASLLKASQPMEPVSTLWAEWFQANQAKLHSRDPALQHVFDRMGIPHTGEQIMAAMRFELSYIKAIIEGQNLDILLWTLEDDHLKFMEKIEAKRKRIALANRIIDRRYARKLSEEKYRADWDAYRAYQAATETYFEDLKYYEKAHKQYDATSDQTAQLWIALSVGLHSAQRAETEAANQYADYIDLTADDMVDAVLLKLKDRFPDDFEGFSPEDRAEIKGQVHELIGQVAQGYVEAVEEANNKRDEVIAHRKHMRPTGWDEATDPSSAVDPDTLEKASNIARGVDWVLTTGDLLSLAKNEKAHPYLAYILEKSGLTEPQFPLSEDLKTKMRNRVPLPVETMERLISNNDELIGGQLSMLQRMSAEERMDAGADPLLELRAILIGHEFSMEQLYQIARDHPTPDLVMADILGNMGDNTLLDDYQKTSSALKNRLSVAVSDFFIKDPTDQSNSEEDSTTFKALLNSAGDMTAFKAVLSTQGQDEFDALMKQHSDNFLQAKEAFIKGLATEVAALSPQPKAFEVGVTALIDKISFEHRQAFKLKLSKAEKTNGSELQSWLKNNKADLTKGLSTLEAKGVRAVHSALSKARENKTRRERDAEHLKMYEEHRDRQELLAQMKIRNKAEIGMASIAEAFMAAKRAKKARQNDDTATPLTQEDQAHIREHIAPACFGSATSPPPGESASATPAGPQAGQTINEMAKKVIKMNRFIQNIQTQRSNLNAQLTEQMTQSIKMAKDIGLLPHNASPSPEKLSAKDKENIDLLQLHTFDSFFKQAPNGQQLKDDVKRFVDAHVNDEDMTSVQEDFRKEFTDQFSDEKHFDKSAQMQMQSYMMLALRLKQRPNAINTIVQEEAFRKAYTQSFLLRDGLPQTFQTSQSIDAQIASIDKQFKPAMPAPRVSSLESTLKDLEADYQKPNGLTYQNYVNKLSLTLQEAGVEPATQQYLSLRYRLSAVRFSLSPGKASTQNQDRLASEADLKALEDEIESLPEDKETAKVKRSVLQVKALQDLNALRLRMDRNLSKMNGLLGKLATGGLSDNDKLAATAAVRTLQKDQQEYSQAMEAFKAGQTELSDAPNMPSPQTHNIKAVNRVVGDVAALTAQRELLERHHATRVGLEAQLRNLQQPKRAQSNLPKAPTITPTDNGAEVLEQLNQRGPNKRGSGFHPTPMGTQPF
jgi:REP element-mobilizing transposase RayT